MLAVQRLVFTLITAMIVSKLNAKTLVLEAENTNSDHRIHDRSAASGNRSVWLHQNDFVTYNFCLLRRTDVLVANVRTSNDGEADSLSVSINGINLGSFQSVSATDAGKMWNSFESSGPVGTAQELEAGQHEVTIRVVSSDFYGVELDVIEFSVEDNELINDTFSCSIPCNIVQPTLTAPNNLVDGKAVQKSFSTECSNDTNVKIPIYNTDVSKYEVIATFTQFPAYENPETENTNKCSVKSSTYFLFENIDIAVAATDPEKVLMDGDSQLFFVFGNPNLYLAIFAFTVRGKNSGYFDSDIGSKIFLEFEPFEDPAAVTFSYSNRNGTSLSSLPVIFGGPKLNHTWTVPDFSWKEDEANAIIINIRTIQRNHVIKKVSIERRDTLPDEVTEIYSSDSIKIKTVSKDFWWLSSDRMTVSMLGGETTIMDVANIQIDYKDPSISDFSQVLSLYQDGNLRLLNPVVPGTEGTDFKTSVIIGQSNPEDYRPSAALKGINIDPATLTLTLFYMDNSMAKLNLTVSQAATRVTVFDMIYAKDQLSYPFATLLSMYVETGLSDSDTISTLSTTERFFGGTWTELDGTTFLLHRRCESKVKTRSPDLELKILETASTTSS